MYNRREHPLCSLCGYEICTLSGISLSVQPFNWDPQQWLSNAVALKGPKHLNDDLEPCSKPEELLTWHTATGPHRTYTYGVMTLVPSGEIIHPHMNISADTSSGIAYWYLGFHNACANIARQFIQLSPTSQLDSFFDIWTTLNARYLKGPKGHGGWDHASSVPRKTPRGTYIWSQEIAYYLPHWTSEDSEEWYSSPPASTSSRLFQERLDSLPQELKDKIISHLGCGLVTEVSNHLLPQSYWKQLLVQIPFLWDLDADKVQQFPDIPGKEWDWERLVRQLMTGPTDSTIVSQEKSWDGARTKVWSYKRAGLDVPLGLTNRRRIWQILDDMDPKELDVLDDPLFWIYDSDFDEFVTATGQEGFDMHDYFHVPDGPW
ncbi:hypothetical protein FSARC_4460 [Fusarium sarcochroum]|uniref:Uncharacterized protein n=1 Tax=Fusarium sarcochroum TaxID=1208366 RepID=A0A8H4U1S0_9HYPO|nr:hypothetical protein FSARC_4460 [Fusarium sarcochroum]